MARALHSESTYEQLIISLSFKSFISRDVKNHAAANEVEIPHILERFFVKLSKIQDFKKQFEKDSKRT